MSFTFGLIRAIASEIDAGKFDPKKQLDNQVNGYIYDSSGKKILAVLRGSEARTLIEYDDIRRSDAARDRGDRGPAVLGARRRSTCAASGGR